MNKDISIFNIGDIVRLNSDGPKMTIERLDSKDDKDFIWCTFWNDGLNEFTYKGFGRDLLKRVD